ncbi:MAG TPA: hypothetical protein VN538_12645 [Clostridia bacterium]|nr:hypothetical protein [Clostridia bacterium]
MNIPQSFLDAQAAAFQDKQISLLATVSTTGALGSVTKSPGAVVSIHACNVQYAADKLLVEQYGLVVGQDLIVTAGALPIAKDSFISYDGVVFRVIETPRSDSHVKLIAKRWQP